MNKRTVARLAAYRRRYGALAAQLADIGFIASGTLAQRFNRCGKPTCACHADPPRLHGPYWHLTFKVDGKTFNRRLSPRQAVTYSEWIANDRPARQLLTKMREITGKAAEVILQEEPTMPD